MIVEIGNTSTNTLGTHPRASCAIWWALFRCLPSRNRRMTVAKQGGRHNGPQKPKPPAHEPQGDGFRQKVIDAAARAGLSKADFGGTGIRKFGDGVLLGKLLDFFKTLLPILLPIIGLEEGATTTAEDGDAELKNEMRNAAAQCGISESEMRTTATAFGWSGTIEKWLKFFLMILPFLAPILDGTEDDDTDPE